MQVLLVEDEFGVGDVVSAYLARSGRSVDWVRTLAEGKHALLNGQHDLLLLDIRLPDGSGLDLLTKLRDAGDMRPVIIISAQDQIRDRIDGLNRGADDYIVKPFNLGEVEARVDAVRRRMQGHPNPKISFANIRIDVPNARVWVLDQEIALSLSEWVLLKCLCGPPGQTVSRSELERALVASGKACQSNAVEVYIGRLRRKLGSGIIQNKRGVGYRLVG